MFLNLKFEKKSNLQKNKIEKKSKKTESRPKCQIMFPKQNNKNTNRVKNYCNRSQNVRKLLIKP